MWRRAATFVDKITTSDVIVLPPIDKIPQSLNIAFAAPSPLRTSQLQQRPRPQ